MKLDSKKEAVNSNDDYTKAGKYEISIRIFQHVCMSYHRNHFKSDLSM